MSEKYEVADTSGWQNRSASGTRLNQPEKVQFWKPKTDDVNTIDILPFKLTKQHFRYIDGAKDPKVGQLYFERTYWVHWKIGVNEDSVVCPAKTFGKKCPLCEKRTELNQSPPHKLDKDQAALLKPKDRQLLFVYDYASPNKGVQLWDVSPFNFNQYLRDFILKSRESVQKKNRNHFLPGKDGRTIRISAQEKPMPNGMNTIFLINEMYDREDPAPAEVYNHGLDLDTVPVEMSYEAILKMYNGVVDDPDADDDDGPGNDEVKDEPKARSDAPSKNGNSKHEDDEPEPKKPTKKPDPKKEVQFASKDKVRFDLRNDGNMVDGTIESVNMDKQVAKVVVPGRERPSMVDFMDLELVESDDTFDLKDTPEDPPAKSKKVKSANWGEEEDRPARRTK